MYLAKTETMTSVIYTYTPSKNCPMLSLGNGPELVGYADSSGRRMLVEFKVERTVEFVESKELSKSGGLEKSLVKDFLESSEKRSVS